MRLPSTAQARRGIQPVVHLQANGVERADIQVGEKVQFIGQIQVPAKTGSIVQVEWDYLGTGDFVPLELAEIKPGNITVQSSHNYTQPGTYFPVLRVALHREGDPGDDYARVQNLGRARVVVEK